MLSQDAQNLELRQAQAEQGALVIDLKLALSGSFETQKKKNNLAYRLEKVNKK